MAKAKKKYTLNIENDKVVSVEVNGTRYKDLEQIPDPEDRVKVQALISSSTALSAPDGGTDVMKIIFPLFIGVAVVMLAISAVSAFLTIRRLMREESAQGVVVDQGIRRNSEGEAYSYPLVEVYVPGRAPQTVQIAEGTWPPPYEEGEQVTVLYIPDEPGQFRVRSLGGSFSLWGLSMLTGTLGMGFLGATLFARWVIKTDFGTKPGSRLFT